MRTLVGADEPDPRPAWVVPYLSVNSNTCTSTSVIWWPVASVSREPYRTTAWVEQPKEIEP